MKEKIQLEFCNFLRLRNKTAKSQLRKTWTSSIKKKKLRKKWKSSLDNVPGSRKCCGKILVFEPAGNYSEKSKRKDRRGELKYMYKKWGVKKKVKERAREAEVKRRIYHYMYSFLHEDETEKPSEKLTCGVIQYQVKMRCRINVKWRSKRQKMWDEDKKEKTDTSEVEGRLANKVKRKRRWKTSGLLFA